MPNVLLLEANVASPWKDCNHMKRDRMMLATCCGQLEKMMLRTDFKTADLGCKVSLFPPIPLGLCFLIVGQCHSPLLCLCPSCSSLPGGWSIQTWLPKTDARGIQVCSFFKVQLKFSLFYKGFLPKQYLSGKKTMGFEVDQTWGGQVITYPLWVTDSSLQNPESLWGLGVQKLVSIKTFVTPTIYLVGALLSWKSKTQESDLLPLALVRFVQ